MYGCTIIDGSCRTTGEDACVDSIKWATPKHTKNESVTVLLKSAGEF